MTFPALFMSHGAPTLVLENSFSAQTIRQLPQKCFKNDPDAIIIFTAHWTTSELKISNNLSYEMIYDFYGFSKDLYNINYPAKGNPALAQDILKACQSYGIFASLDPLRGLDHGSWSVLSMLFPKANIPVIQMSVQPDLPAIHHYQIGKALKSFRDKNILIIGSGGLTHNLSQMGHYPQVPQWVSQFIDWIHTQFNTQNVNNVLNYADFAPYALDNHPTSEHLMPLFNILGTCADQPLDVKAFNQEIDYGVISMESFLFI